MSSILLVGQDEFLAKKFKKVLSTKGFEVFSAQSRIGINRQLAKHRFSALVIFEPALLSSELVNSVRDFFDQPKIIVRANGEFSRLKQCFGSAIDLLNFEKEIELEAILMDQEKGFEAGMENFGIIAKSPAMTKAWELIKKASQSEGTILITGESGTGKELFARATHKLSPRRNQPFVAINCSAIPEALLESELFGYYKGAFTGARENKEGKVESAQEGILFLDEVSEVNMKVQAKLLRLLEDKEFIKLGETSPRYAQCRIISATNQNLCQLVKTGRFRSDLFFRLNVFNIHLPPLRERKEDIPLLIEHFLEQAKKKFSAQLEGITPQVMEILINYPWPGNVRELMNLITRLVLHKGEGKIELNDLPSEYHRYIFREFKSGLVINQSNFND